MGASERQHRSEQIAESDGPSAPRVWNSHPHGPYMGVWFRLSYHACAARILVLILHLQRVSGIRDLYFLLCSTEARACAMVRFLHM